MTPSGPEFKSLLDLCRSENIACHPDRKVRAAATKMHWQLLWTRRHQAGAAVRRDRDKVLVFPGARHSKPLTDVRRMHQRLRTGDVKGFAKAWIEASPYVREKVLAATDSGDLVSRLDVLLQSDRSLRGRPSFGEHKRCAQWLRSLWLWLHDEQGSSAVGWDAFAERPSGDLYVFVHKVSLLYGLAIVTERSAHRLKHAAGRA